MVDVQVHFCIAAGTDVLSVGCGVGLKWFLYLVSEPEKLCTLQVSLSEVGQDIP